MASGQSKITVHYFIAEKIQEMHLLIHLGHSLKVSRATSADQLATVPENHHVYWPNPLATF